MFTFKKTGNYKINLFQKCLRFIKIYSLLSKEIFSDMI